MPFMSARVPAGHSMVVVVVVSRGRVVVVVLVVVVSLVVVSLRGAGVEWTEMQPDSKGDAKSTAIRF